MLSLLVVVIITATTMVTGVLGDRGYASVVGWRAVAFTFCAITWAHTGNRDAHRSIARVAPPDTAPVAIDHPIHNFLDGL